MLPGVCCNDPVALEAMLERYSCCSDGLAVSMCGGSLAPVAPLAGRGCILMFSLFVTTLALLRMRPRRRSSSPLSPQPPPGRWPP